MSVEKAVDLYVLGTFILFEGEKRRWKFLLSCVIGLQGREAGFDHTEHLEWNEGGKWRMSRKMAGCITLALSFFMPTRYMFLCHVNAWFWWVSDLSNNQAGSNQSFQQTVPLGARTSRKWLSLPFLVRTTLSLPFLVRTIYQNLHSAKCVTICKWKNAVHDDYTMLDTDCEQMFT